MCGLPMAIVNPFEAVVLPVELYRQGKVVVLVEDYPHDPSAGVVVEVGLLELLVVLYYLVDALAVHFVYLAGVDAVVLDLLNLLLPVQATTPGSWISLNGAR